MFEFFYKCSKIHLFFILSIVSLLNTSIWFSIIEDGRFTLCDNRNLTTYQKPTTSLKTSANRTDESGEKYVIYQCIDGMLCGGLADRVF